MTTADMEYLWSYDRRNTATAQSRHGVLSNLRFHVPRSKKFPSYSKQSTPKALDQSTPSSQREIPKVSLLTHRNVRQSCTFYNATTSKTSNLHPSVYVISHSHTFLHTNSQEKLRAQMLPGGGIPATHCVEAQWRRCVSIRGAVPF